MNNTPRELTWRNKYWFSFMVIRFFYVFFALEVYSKFTRLGDTFGYLSGGKINAGLILFESTTLMSLIASSFSKVLGVYGANIIFMLFASYGIFYALKKSRLPQKYYVAVLLVLCTPSFSVWTSIASKEAVGCFFMGVILGFMFDLNEDRKRMPNMIEWFAFYLLIVFKPQYLSAILPLICFIKFSKWLNFKAYGKGFLLVSVFVCFVVFLYSFRTEINEVSFVLPAHFNADAGSTRENTVWVEQNDVFRNAPYGMFISFLGPTWQEVLQKPVQGIAFFESIFIMTFMSYFLLKMLLYSLTRLRINIKYLSYLSISYIFILFVHYPFGVLNPGSAIRYRENFLAFLIILTVYSYYKIKGGNNEKSHPY